MVSEVECSHPVYMVKKQKANLTIKLLSPLCDDVICGRSLIFEHVVFVNLVVNEFCVKLRTAGYIYVLKAV